ncbi:MAG TPA: protein YhfH [Bacillota bacterium]|nr:protein YhfH [Bacillota bacterium]
MINVLKFFRNLPEKRCYACGDIIYEQAECYSNLCNECNKPT